MARLYLGADRGIVGRRCAELKAADGHAQQMGDDVTSRIVKRGTALL